MRATLQVVVVALALAAGLDARADGGGISADPARVSWTRFQGRIAYTATPAWRSDLAPAESSGLKLGGASVMGDIYLSPSLGGLRATSGIFYGTRTGLWGTQATASSLRRLGVERRVLGAPLAPAAGDAPADSATLPYIGIGYSRLAPHGGWSFSADVGLMSLSPGNAVRLGRVFSGGQSLDDVVRDMRLAPVFQLGVSYSF